MFADNQRVSRLQVERQFLLAYLGPVILWLVPELKGREGVWSIVLGAGILCIWIFFLLRQVHVYRYPEKYWGTFMSRGIAFVYQIYLILTGGWIVAQTGEILTGYLVQGIPVRAAAGILVLAALGGSQHVQARGRFAQVSWGLVGSLTVVMFLFAAFQGEPEYLMAQSRQKWDGKDFREIVHGTGWFLSGFLGIGLLPFLMVQTDGKTGHAGFLFRTVGKMSLGMCGILVILEAVFGERGAEALKYPVLDLMAGVRLPGGFLRRIDLIFLSVILFSLLFTLGSIFFYSKYICERVNLSASRIPAAALSFLIGTADLGRWSLVEEYPKIMLWIFLPLFLVLTVCSSFVRRRTYGK